MGEQPSRIARRRRAAVILFVLLLGATASPLPAGAAPTGPAATQLGWVLRQVNAARTPSDAEISQHCSAAFLQDVPPAALDAAIAGLSAQRPVRITGMSGAADPLKLVAELSAAHGPGLRISISVSQRSPNQIETLDVTPFDRLPPISSWASAGRALGRLGSHVGVFVAGVRGGRVGRIIYARDADAPGAIGSEFKLYVLGALAQAVRDKRAAWDEQLAIHDRWKSLPSGSMQDDAAGARFSLRYYAEQMISVSDNTAADHLIQRLGRAAVEHELVTFGNHAVVKNRPFLTTRESFALKLVAPPALVAAYTTGDARTRRALLARLDALPLTVASTSSWFAPRQINTVEWFASPSDIARAMVALEALAREPGLGPVGSTLELNPGIQLDPSKWTTVAFKGGTEPGVLSLTWYLVRADGQAFVVSIVVNDAKYPLDENAAVGVAAHGIALLDH